MQQEYFEPLLQALRKQQEIWEQLKEENWQLRQQLADLRAAQGVVVVIEGKRFVLTGGAGETTPTTEPVAAPVAPYLPARAQTVPLPRHEETTNNTGAFQQTRPMALRPNSAPQEEPAEPAHEEEKAKLQRELAGSFLLTHEA